MPVGGVHGHMEIISKHYTIQILIRTHHTIFFPVYDIVRIHAQCMVHCAHIAIELSKELHVGVIFSSCTYNVTIIIIIPINIPQS